MVDNLFAHKERFAVIIVDRGDDKKATRKCMQQLNKQTEKPSEVIIVNRNPTSGMDDLTLRAREGLYVAVKRNVPFVFVWSVHEDYPPLYFQTMDRKDLDFVFDIRSTSFYRMGFRLSAIKDYEFHYIKDDHLGLNIKGYALGYRHKSYKI